MKRISRPYYIDWAITYQCNLKCAHCRGNSPTRIPTERAMSLLDEIKALNPGWLIIEGGEPLMHEDLFPILRYANELGLTVRIITNGTLLTEEKIDWFARMGIKVMVSIDSPDAGTFETIRKGANFTDVTRATSLCAEKGILDAINFTISRSNISQIPELFRMAKRIDAERINILGLKPCAEYLTQLLSPDEYRAAIEACCRASLDTGLPFFFDEPFFHAAARVWKLDHQKNIKGSSITIANEPGCILGKYLFITADGNVWPCSFAPQVMGNVMRENLGDIWNRMAKSEFIRQCADIRARQGACGPCSHLSECGGCRARAFKLTGDWFAADPVCPLARRGRSSKHEI